MGTNTFELAIPYGQPLRGDLFCPEDTPAPWPVVVVCHGFKGFKNWGFFPELGRRLSGAGFAAVLFNFSGAGIGPDLLNFTDLEGFAQDTVSRQVDDLGRVLDAVQAGQIGSERLDLKRLAVLGHSRGGGTAILRAGEDRRIKAVATWSAISTFSRYSEREIAAWKERGHLEFLNTRTGQQMRIDAGYLEDLETNGQRLDVLRAASELQVPLLLVHGEEDLSVPLREARELHQATGGRAELLRIPRTGHTFGAVHPWQGSTSALDRAIQGSIDWLGKQMRATA